MPFVNENPQVGQILRISGFNRIPNELRGLGEYGMSQGT